MSYPLVSIIIPVYNSEKYLEETINSALNQTWINKEIIIVDNGSTDNSVEIAQRFGNRLKLFNEVHRGASAARNKGLAEAKGDYIQFLDADDLLAPDKITLQVEAVQINPGVIAYGSYMNFFEGDDLNKQQAECYIHKNFDSGKELLFNLYGGNDENKSGGIIPQHSWLTPRSVINTSGPWNTELTVDDDGEFFCRVVLNSNGIKYVPDALCYYRRHKHNKNLSAQKSLKSLQSAFTSIKLKYKHLGDSKATNPLVANQAMHLLVNAYPQYTELCKQLQQFINTIGGASWMPYREGWHKIARQLFGWKAMRLLNYYKNLKTANGAK